MHIRITHECSAPLDGFSIAPLVVGRVYDIKDSTAAFLIAKGCAELYREPESATGSPDDHSLNCTPRTTRPLGTAAARIQSIASVTLRLLAPPPERVLWRLAKGERIAEARVRERNHGCELQFLVDGRLWWSQLLCPNSSELMPRAIERREELERLGWTPWTGGVTVPSLRPISNNS